MAGTVSAYLALHGGSDDDGLQISGNCRIYQVERGRVNHQLAVIQALSLLLNARPRGRRRESTPSEAQIPVGLLT